MNTPKILTVCIAGAEAEVVTRFAAMLEEQRRRLDTHWQLGNHASADLLVIDIDSLYGHMDWVKASATGRLVASWSSASETGDAQLSLRKPIVVDDLVAVLNRADLQLNGAYSQPAKPQKESAPARPAPEPAPPPIIEPVAAALAADTPGTAPIAAPPRGMQLIDLLETDSPLKGHLRLAADGLPTLLLDPHHRAWHTESTLKTLSAWCTRTLSSLDVQSVDDVQFSNVTAKMPGQPYARLKWLAHLVHGQGRLDPDLDVNGRYKLARWPQSEREFPKHFRIATIMLKQASTLDEVAAYAGATIAEVADFINGYHAIGYIERDPPESAQEDTRRGGLFGRARKASTN